MLAVAVPSGFGDREYLYAESLPRSSRVGAGFAADKRKLAAWRSSYFRYVDPPPAAPLPPGSHSTCSAQRARITPTDSLGPPPAIAVDPDCPPLRERVTTRVGSARRARLLSLASQPLLAGCRLLDTRYP